MNYKKYKGTKFSEYYKEKIKMIKKLELKFNEVGIHGAWAQNAARRAVELYEKGMDFEEAVYLVYREL